MKKITKEIKCTVKGYPLMDLPKRRTLLNIE